jgi:hypothetical protein
MDMDMSEFFQSRQAKDLEDVFFLKKDKKLIDALQKMEKMKETKEVLAEVSGISNDDILHKLVELNVRPEVLATLALVPLVEIAWADGKVDAKEKAAVMQATHHSFIESSPADTELLERWMTIRPDPKLLDAWVVYVKGLCQKLTPQERDSLRDDIIGHAVDVAKSSGGFLGIGKKTSPAEQDMLDKLRAAFK